MWFVRLVSVFLVLVSIERIYSAWHDHQHWQGIKLWLTRCFIFFWFGSVGLPMIFSGHPYFSHNYFYTLIIGLGLLALTPQGANKFILAFRNASILYLLIGFLMILVKPSLVLESGYSQGYIPGLPRFSGFAPYALALGQLALVSTIVLFQYPVENRLINNASIVICMTAVFLSQSKTAWVTALIILPIMIWHRPKSLVTNHRRSDYFFLPLLAGAFLLLGTLIAFFTVSGVAETLEKFSGSSTGIQLASINGRNIIWELSLAEWIQNPIFGYGPLFLDLPYRLVIGLVNATHAHNEFIDLMARSGLVGLFSVIPYLVIMVIIVRKANASNKGFVVSFFVLELLQCLTEVPLSLFGYGLQFLIQMSLLAALMISHQNHDEGLSLADSRLARGPY
jgi:O-antigen ligase